MTSLRFSKMHGAGNDFVVFDGVRQNIDLSILQRQLIADRHRGIGCDQILVVEKSVLPAVDFRYRIFNADGGEVEQCGNGARCFARFVHQTGLSDKTTLVVETKKGVITLLRNKDDSVSVDMGAPRFMPADIPFFPPLGSAENAQPFTLDILQKPCEIRVVSMGNPHAVVIVQEVDSAPVQEHGVLLESHPAFPERVNVGFMQIIDTHTIRLRVFERGSGETLACGTGACAAAAVGIRAGFLQSPVRVAMQGGELHIAWAGGAADSVLMTGPATLVFSGKITL